MQAALAVAPARAGVSPRPIPAARRQGLGILSRAPLARPTPLQHCSRIQLGLAPKALPGTDNLRELDIPADARSNLPAWLTLLGYVAVHASSFRYVPTPQLLFTGLAGYQLLWSALTLLTSKFEFDRVGAVIAPIFLSVQALPQLASRISPLDTANGLFGYYLARDLPGPIWLWLPTLAYAIYTGYGSHWAVAAFGLGNLYKLVQGKQEVGLPAVQHLAFAALGAWGIYSRQHRLLALLIYAGQLVASVAS